MKLHISSLICIVLLVSYCTANENVNASEEKLNPIESDEQLDGYVTEDDQEPDQNHDHNHDQDPDQDQVLDQDESEERDELPPEEAKTKLSLIYDKIDADEDGKVTGDELLAHIRAVHEAFLTKDTDKAWTVHVGENQTEVTWESYAQKTYGRVEIPNIKLNTEELEEDNEESLLPIVMKNDKKRFVKADIEKDGKLTKEEFHAFLHPEDVPRMRETVIDDTMMHMDKNRDGFVSAAEYFADLLGNAEPSEDEDDWKKIIRDEFHQSKDKNGDGKLDRDEIQAWIMPDVYDHNMAEATHLVEQSDTDKDGKLSKEEVLNKFELFVGSKATQYGQALREHDEL